MTLDQLLSSFQETKIDKAYVYDHALMVKDILNELLEEHPNWYTALYAISQYSLQKWANEQREQMNISTADFLKAVHRNESYFGFERPKEILCQAQTLYTTGQVIELIENNMMDGILEAIHDGEGTCSFFLVREYYKDAIAYLCECIAKEVDEQFQPIRTTIQSMEGDYQFIYHDIRTLLRIKPLLEEQILMNKSMDSLDAQELVRGVNQCIIALQDYPFCEDVARIIGYFAQGETEHTTALTIGKSREYVRKRYRDGQRAISAILWGYANRELIK